MIKPLLIILFVANAVTAQEITPVTTEMQTIVRGLNDIESSNAKTRRSAILLLGKYEKPSAITAVCNALEDPSPEVRQTALVTVREKVIINSSNPNSFFDKSNVKFADPLNNDKNIINIIKLFGDDKVDIRRLASSAIRELNIMIILSGSNKNLEIYCIDPQIRKIITNAFTDKDSGVRQNMFASYSYFKSIIPTQLLIDALKDESREVRTNALTALLSYHFEFASQNIDKLMASKDKAIRRTVIERLRYKANLSVVKKMMLSLIDDEDPIVAGQALFALLYRHTIIDEKQIIKVTDRLAYESPKLGNSIINQMGNSKRYSKILRKVSSNPQSPYRISAMVSLARCDKESISVAELISMMDTSDKTLLRACKNTLLMKIFTINDLLPLIESEHLAVRQLVLGIAYKFRGIHERTELIGELILDENETLRASAISKYIAYRCTDWMEISKAALEDDSMVVVYESVRSLLRNRIDGYQILRQKFTAKPGFNEKILQHAILKKDAYTYKTLINFK